MPTVSHINNQTAKQLLENAKDLYLNAIKEKIQTDRITGRSYAKTPLDDTQAVIFDGEVKTVLVRKPLDDQKCIIDWLTITMDAQQFWCHHAPARCWTDHQRENYAAQVVGKQLQRIIGFGIDHESPTGRNFYRRSYNLENNVGFICVGGQKDTLLITINGTGCTYANISWEFAMFSWLASLVIEPKITRIDLALDLLDGQKDFLTVDTFNQVHTNGGFCKGGRNPSIEYRGNWKKPDGKGRTLYIGSRQSSKFCRIYERGMMLGKPNSTWLRIEVEFKGKDVYIPLNVLLDPSDYFMAAYPCFFIFGEDQDFISRFEKREKEEYITFDKAIEIVKTQYGRYLHFFRQCYQNDSKLLDILTDIQNKNVPERLNILTIPKNLIPPKGIDLGD